MQLSDEENRIQITVELYNDGNYPVSKVPKSSRFKLCWQGRWQADVLCKPVDLRLSQFRSQLQGKTINTSPLCF
jgi:hypothetical protein